MKATVINSKELGTNCWLPNKVLGRCDKCDRFGICRYPELSVRSRIDMLHEAIERKKEEIRKLEKEASKYE